MTASDGLTVQEKLLLAQAVYKVGAVDWTTISTLLLDHPICKTRPSALFSPSACEETYISMMTSIGQNVPAPDAMKPRNKIHLRLAQTFYVARLQELKEEIESCENRFSVVMGEINALKNGSMDDEIKEEIKGGLVKKYGQRILQWLPDEPNTFEPETKPSEPSAQHDEPKVDDETKAESPETKVTEERVDEKAPEEVQDLTAPDSPAEEAEEATPKAAPSEAEPEMNVDEPVVTPKPSPSPSDDLSPPPSAVKDSDGSATPAQTAPSPSPAEPAKTSKRKASTQPRGAPIAKRGPGRPRRATTPVPTPSEQPSDTEPAEQEAEEDQEDTGRSRRLSKRHRAQDSPPQTSRTRGSSPATSRRAPSVSSVASTPTVEEKKPRRGGRGGRGMRDEVVSKSVREQSTAAESVKEEDEDEADSPAEEEKSRPVRGRRGKKEPSPVEDKKEKDGGRRSTRSAKTPTLHGHEGDDDAAEEEGGRSKRRSTFTPTQSATPATGAAEGKKGPRKSEPKDAKATQRLLLNLWEDIHGHQHGAVFHAPVKKSEAADYYSIIKKPMDLKTIKLRVKDGTITSIDEFERDILLMFANATMYNEEGSQVYDMAVEMSKAVEGKIAHFRGLLNDLKR